MYECPGCAGNLKFDIAKQKLYCEHCGMSLSPYEVQKEQDAEEQKDAYEVTVFTCPQCGGEIISEDTTAATFCSFCGAATILDSRVSRERRPVQIIPFQKTKEDCRQSYAKMMRRAIFAPKELKDAAHIEKFRGIYMPYWVYSFEKSGGASFPGTKTYRRGDYVYTSHYELNCDIEESYKGLTYDASASFDDNLSEAIAPFDLRKGKEFTPSFLSGFYADTSDVNSFVYVNDAEDMVTEDGSERLSKSPACRKYSVLPYHLKNAVRPTKRETELAMFPVWFLAYRNKDRVSYAVVNGQTGKAAAEIPMDPKKYLLGSAILTLPIFFLLNLFFTVTPTKSLWAAIFMAVISLLISNVQLSKLFARAAGIQDKGLASVQPIPENIGEVIEEERLRRGEKWRREQEEKENFFGGRIFRILRPILLMIVLMSLMQTLLPFLLMTVIAGRRSSGFMGTMQIFFMVIFMFVLVSLVSRLGKNGKSRSAGNVKKIRYMGNLKEKMPVLWKPLAGILAGILLLMFQPVHDWFYYIGGILCAGMVLWAFLDIIHQHNELTTRKLPQFNRRGGDGNA